MSELQRSEFGASKASYTTLHCMLHRHSTTWQGVDEGDNVAISDTHERQRHATQNHYAKRRFVYLVGKRSEESAQRIQGGKEGGGTHELSPCTPPST